MYLKKVLALGLHHKLRHFDELQEYFLKIG